MALVGAMVWSAAMIGVVVVAVLVTQSRQKEVAERSDNARVLHACERALALKAHQISQNGDVQPITVTIDGVDVAVTPAQGAAAGDVAIDVEAVATYRDGSNADRVVQVLATLRKKPQLAGYLRGAVFATGALTLRGDVTTESFLGDQGYPAADNRFANGNVGANGAVALSAISVTSEYGGVAEAPAGGEGVDEARYESEASDEGEAEAASDSDADASDSTAESDREASDSTGGADEHDGQEDEDAGSGGLGGFVGSAPAKLVHKHLRKLGRSRRGARRAEPDDDEAADSGAASESHENEAEADSGQRVDGSEAEEDGAAEESDGEREQNDSTNGTSGETAGGTATLTVAPRVDGFVEYSDPALATIAPEAQVAGQRKLAAPPVLPDLVGSQFDDAWTGTKNNPTVLVDGVAQQPAAQGQLTIDGGEAALAEGVYVLDRLVLANGAYLTVSGKVQIFANDVQLLDGSVLDVSGGTVELFYKDSWKLTNGAQVFNGLEADGSLRTEDFVALGLAGSALEITGGAEVTGLVYSPEGDVSAEDLHLMGALVGHQVEVVGNVVASYTPPATNGANASAGGWVITSSGALLQFDESLAGRVGTEVGRTYGVQSLAEQGVRNEMSQALQAHQATKAAAPAGNAAGNAATTGGNPSSPVVASPNGGGGSANAGAAAPSGLVQ
ncbi:MAG: hypothetical protein D6776_10045 [Planctomycetota bacterium]|nr:MAG: hypothetical protein D6776_10045 [Planctomycetota bacterium]